ncbi:MAG: hypothetical protein O7A64_07160, partial [Alphaproteobacteria bacterium]|nr:hypothetical protein [Alphaproteobacteria bacterium]
MKGKGLFLIACALAGCAAPGERRAATIVPVGLARVDITPDYPVRLTGYGGRRAESAGVEQRLWAKALAIGEEPAVIVTVDNCAVPAWMVEKVAARISVRR